jgi:hypothetical protein
VSKECQLTPKRFNGYIEHVVKQEPIIWNNHSPIRQTISDTVLFADDQVVIDRIEDDLQLSWQILNKRVGSTILKYLLLQKVMTFEESEHIWGTTFNYKITEQIKEFNYLGCNMSYVNNSDLRLYDTLQRVQCKYMWKYTAIVKNTP